MIEEGTTNEATTSATPAPSTPDACQAEALTEAPAVVPTIQAVEPELPPIDELSTPAYEPNEEERKFRSRGEDHRVLSRKHKPAITQERAAELEARVTEVADLRQTLVEAKRDLARFEARAKQTEFPADMPVTEQISAIEDANSLVLIQKSLIESLEKQVAQRSLTQLSRIHFFYYKTNGLLTEKDLTKLRAADARRARRTERTQALASRGAFRGSELASQRAAEYTGPVNTATKSTRPERRRALRDVLRGPNAVDYAPTP